MLLLYILKGGVCCAQLVHRGDAALQRVTFGLVALWLLSFSFFWCYTSCFLFQESSVGNDLVTCGRDRDHDLFSQARFRFFNSISLFSESGSADLSINMVMSSAYDWTLSSSYCCLCCMRVIMVSPVSPNLAFIPT